MIEIYYVFKSYKKLYILSGLDYENKFMIGFDIYIHRSFFNININLMCFDFVFEIGLIQEENRIDSK